MKSQSISYLVSGIEHIYILDFGPWTWGALNMGFVDYMAVKNARTIFILF